MLSLSKLRNELEALKKSHRKLLFLCLGNEIMGEDIIGILVGKEIKQAIEFPVIIAHNTPARFLMEISEYSPDLIIVIDSVELGQSPGTIALIPYSSFINTGSLTTHYQDFDKLLKFIEIETGKAVKIIILGIQISNINLGIDINRKQLQTVQNVIELIISIFSA